jgi:hypothetical protein
MTSLILYSNKDSKNLYGIRQIDNVLFKKLMYNEIHKKCRFVVPKEKVEKEFDTKLNGSGQDVDLIVMSTLSKNQLETYLDTYQDETDNLEKFIEFTQIITYNQINPEKFRVKRKFEQMLSSISEYWEDSYNCNFTLTDKFIARRFNNSNYLNNIETINNAILEQNKNVGSVDWNSREVNYLNDLIKNKNNSWDNMCIKKYYTSAISSFTNSDITLIYKQIPNEYIKYLFLTNLLGSRSHCHLVLNNRELLQLTKPMFDKYKIIFKYLIGYAWITLKNEEYHVYHKIKDTDRIVFDINTANLLPVFPFTWDDINQNPYASVLVDKDIMDLKHNCLSLNMMRSYEKYYGVCTSEEFSRRLNIFVNGSNKKGILDCIDWDCCVITGSVMTACGMKRNPLIDICKTDNNQNVITDADLSNYFFHYYQDSDIDLICNKKTMSEFIDVVDKFVKGVKKLSNNKVSISNVHTGTIIMSDEFISQELDGLKKALKSDKIDIQYIKSNLSNQDIKNYFYDKFYIRWKTEKANDNMDKSNELVREYLKLIPREEFRLINLSYDLNEEKMNKKDWEKYFYLNEIIEVPEHENKLIAKLSESIRFKVSSPISKTFEIFKSADDNFFSTVSKFHMGFVRAIWNGSAVLCLPSYITSMMLQIATDYKYFASIRDPIEIVNKYRSRGWGVILNDYEKLHMAYYNSVKLNGSDANEKWIQMYKINLKSKQSIENIFGAKSSSDDIFKPSKYFMGIPQDCFKDIKHETSSSFDECFGSLITPSTSSIARFKAIGDNGKINPLAREVIMMGWSLLNPSQQANLI